MAGPRLKYLATLLLVRQLAPPSWVDRVSVLSRLSLRPAKHRGWATRL